jgi:hypothetical protein
MIIQMAKSKTIGIVLTIFVFLIGCGIFLIQIDNTTFDKRLSDQFVSNELVLNELINQGLEPGGETEIGISSTFSPDIFDFFKEKAISANNNFSKALWSLLAGAFRNSFNSLGMLFYGLLFGSALLLWQRYNEKNKINSKTKIVFIILISILFLLFFYSTIYKSLSQYSFIMSFIVIGEKIAELFSTCLGILIILFFGIKKLRNKILSRFAIICLIIIIATVITGCVQQEEQIDLQSKLIPDVKEEIVPIDLNEYHNDNYGFSINYPSNWKQTEMELPDEPIPAIVFSPEIPHNSYFAENVLVGIMDNEPGLFGGEENLPYKDFIEIGLKAGKDVYGEDYSPIEEIYVSGHQAYKYTVTKEREMYALKQTTINMLIGDRTYMVIASTTDLSSAQEIKDTELILNSFRVE